MDVDTIASIGELLGWVFLGIGVPISLVGALIGYVQRRRLEGTGRVAHSPTARLLQVIGGVLSVSGLIGLLLSLLPMVFA